MKQQIVGILTHHLPDVCHYRSTAFPSWLHHPEFHRWLVLGFAGFGAALTGLVLPWFLSRAFRVRAAQPPAPHDTTQAPPSTRSSNDSSNANQMPLSPSINVDAHIQQIRRRVAASRSDNLMTAAAFAVNKSRRAEDKSD